MKPSSFTFRRPDRLDDAVALLAQSGGDAKLIAGGQSLVPAMNLRLAAPQMLVDLSGVSELRDLGLDDNGNLVAGAMVTHSRFLRDTAAVTGWPILAHALPFVAHEQVRNRGTIGGSLSHADPAAEWPALCMLLGATVHVTGSRGVRAIAASSFPTGVYETALEPGEILTRVVFPAQPSGMRWGFHEVSRRHGDFALAGAMTGVQLDAQGGLQCLRLVVFAVEDTAQQLEGELSAFLGKKMDATTIDAMGLTAAACVNPRSDLHASAELRLDLVHACVCAALKQAMELPGKESGHD